MTNDSDEATTSSVPMIHGEHATSEIGQILRAAIDSKVPVETIERLVALKERIEMRSAAMDFNAALAAFQAECPPIRKTSKASITTKSGGQYAYTYAELDEIARTTRPILTKHGLSYSWDSEVNGNRLTCVCIVRHVAGHSQTAKFNVSTETTSAMSDQQKMAAALTTARRHSLIQALGLTTTDADTDGAEHSSEAITEEQAFEIKKLIETSGADAAKFLAFVGAKTVEAIPASKFAGAKKALLDRAKKS